MMNEMMEGTLREWKMLLGRVLLAPLFIFFGYAKIGGFDGMVGYASSVGIPFPEVAIVLAIIIELGGGILLLVGWQTRLAAKALAVFCLVTAFLFHTNFSDMTQMTMFWKNIALAGGLLFVAASGAGSLSLDAKLKKKM